MYQAQWGNKGFLVSPNKIITLKDFSAKFGVKSDDKNKSQGKNPHEMTIGVTYLRAAGTDPRVQYEEWCSYVGESHPMYIGGKRFGPARMKLTDVQMSGSRIGDNGDFLSATMSLAFTEVPYTPPAPRKATTVSKTETVATTEQAGSSVSKPTVSALKNTKGDFISVVNQVVENDPLTKAKKREAEALQQVTAKLKIKNVAQKDYDNAVAQGRSAEVIDKRKKWLDTCIAESRKANKAHDDARKAVQALVHENGIIKNNAQKAQKNSSSGKTQGGGGGSY